VAIAISIGSVDSVRRTLSLPLAVGATLAAARTAAWLLRPRVPRPPAEQVDARAYFSDAELARARAFRRPQRVIAAAALVLDVALTARAIRRPPGRSLPPVAGGAAGAAALNLGSAVAGLPLGALSRKRSLDAGLATQSWRDWGIDLVKAQAISTTFAAAAGALLVAGMRRFGDRWWLPGAGALAGTGVLALWVGPTLLDPIFNTFTPAEPDLRDDVVALAASGGVKVDRVLVVDASRRTTASNAYVTGLGPTKRVVFFDNLLADFTRDEVRFVVAHELSHVRHRDVPRALAQLAVVAPVLTLAAQTIAEDGLGAQADARAVPAVAAALGLLAPAVAIAGAQLSRAVERRADAFALDLTKDPQTLIDFHRQIAVKNLVEPDPPRWLQALAGSHPTTLERIGIAEAVRRCAS
jgi:STE24 endopeptidase